MLDPDYLEQAGEWVAIEYAIIERELCDELATAILTADMSDYPARPYFGIAIALMAQDEAPKLRAIINAHKGKVSQSVQREVEEAIRLSDAADLQRIREALGVEAVAKVGPVQTALITRQIVDMLERDNIDLMAGARDAYLREVTAAVTRAGTGAMSIDESMTRAALHLARQGISMVQYRDPTTGDKTVKNHIDVAVRRNIRSQLSQATARRTMEVCQDVGAEFVEVSSHFGARPSHQSWEGKVYSLHGPVTVNGVTYQDFGESTGYYGTGPFGSLGDRLLGVNCRHHFAPWFPGMPRAYKPNPKHPSGKSNKEIYDLTQKQRTLERAIRSTKRELSAAEIAYKQYPTQANMNQVNKCKDILRKQKKAIKDLCESNKDVLTRQVNRERV